MSRDNLQWRGQVGTLEMVPWVSVKGTLARNDAAPKGKHISSTFHTSLDERRITDSDVNLGMLL